MLVFSVIKWGLLIVLVATNTIQLVLYLRVRKFFERLPVVAAEITQSRMVHYNDVEGRTVYEAEIRFRYRFAGNEFESVTPSLRSPQLFPTWNYEDELFRRYRKGDVVNARVIPAAPQVAYLEVGPFSLTSAVVLPLATVAYVLMLVVVGRLLFGS